MYVVEHINNENIYIDKIDALSISVTKDIDKALRFESEEDVNLEFKKFRKTITTFKIVKI
jgi:hypothetical protein